MSPDQVERIVEACDEGSLKLNGVSFEEGMERAHRIFAVFTSLIAQIRTKDQLCKQLGDSPQLSWKDERAFRAMCKYSPHLLRIALRALANDAAKDLPKPPGGRPNALTHSAQIAALEYLKKLHF